MIKNYFHPLFIAAILCSASAVAQPTLTYSNMMPTMGLTYTNLMHQSAGVTAGPGGANQTWDFSQVGAGASPTTVTVHQTAGSPYQNTFPGSSHYTTNTSDNSMGFVTFDNAGYSVKGLMVNNAPTFTYSDPMKLMAFPFTYNSTFTDQYTATYVVNGMTVTRQGNINTFADGYGTLILPNGQTYSDVLRFRVTDQITDDFMGFPVVTNTDSYYWYKIGLPAGLFSIVSTTIGAQTSTAVVSLQSSTVGVEESTTNQLALVYPNPAKGSVTVRTGFDKPVSATLLNGLGQEVRKQTISASEDQFLLDGISAGVYFLQLQSGEKAVVKKLVVE